MADAALNISQDDFFNIRVSTADPVAAHPNYPQVLTQCQREMKDFLAGNLTKNLQALQELEPELFLLFKDYKWRKPVEFMCTTSCVPNLFLLNQYGFFYTAFDPIEYCDKQIDLYLANKRCMQAYFAEEKEKLGQIHFRYINDLLRYQRSNLPASVTLAQTKAAPCVSIFGVGLGYHIAHLYESVDIGTLIIDEPDPDLFYASLHCFDWDNLLRFIHNDPLREIKIFVGLSPEQFKQQLTKFYTDGRNILSDFYWSMRHYDSSATRAHELASMSIFNNINKSIGFFDSRLFAISQSYNNIMQHCRFVKQLKYRGKASPEVLIRNHLTSTLTLPEKLLHTPVCVVANGPSLSDDLPFLRQIQDKVLLIACGTALETLYNAGIQPHFYAAIERLKQIADVVSLIPDTNYLKDIILLSTDTIHPETAKLFKRQAIFFKPNEPCLNFLEYYRPEQAIDLEPVYCANPLVGNMGLAAATSLGFKQIYMFGVDNGSARADKRQHPEESVTYSKVLADATSSVAAEDKKVSELNIEKPGNFVDKVSTNVLYNTSACTMEMLIQGNQDLKYFNCSNGLRVEGAKPVHSASLLEAWQQLPEVDLDSLYTSLEEQLTCTIDLSVEESEAWCDKPMFNHMVLSFFKLMGIQTAETANLDIDTLPPEGTAQCKAQSQAQRQSELKIEPLYDCHIPEYESRLDYMQLIFKLVKFLHKIEQTPRMRKLASFLDGSLTNYFTLTMRSMYLSTTEQEAIERARMHLKTMAYFLDDARRLYIKFAPYYCEYYHRECLNGKIGFDHAESPAPELIPYIPLVTQKDRDMYPVKVFQKRYS